MVYISYELHICELFFFHIGTKPNIELIFRNIVNMHVEKNETSFTRNQVPMILQ